VPRLTEFLNIIGRGQPIFFGPQQPSKEVSPLTRQLADDRDLPRLPGCENGRRRKYRQPKMPLTVSKAIRELSQKSERSPENALRIEWSALQRIEREETASGCRSGEGTVGGV
jgi:hypothetical protein